MSNTRVRVSNLNPNLHILSILNQLCVVYSSTGCVYHGAPCSKTPSLFLPKMREGRQYHFLEVAVSSSMLYHRHVAWVSPRTTLLLTNRLLAGLVSICFNEQLIPNCVCSLALLLVMSDLPSYVHHLLQAPALSETVLCNVIKVCLGIIKPLIYITKHGFLKLYLISPIT